MIILLEKGVWLFWSAAEVALVLLVRAWLSRLEGGRGASRTATVLGVAFLLLLAALVFGWEDLFWTRLARRWAPAPMIFDWALWNFGVTLWVALELVILVYIVRLFGLLRGEVATPGRLKSLRWGAVALAAGSYALWLAYVLGLVAVVRDHGLGEDQIENISRFYIKICGALWILIESACAVYAVRAYRLLARAS